MNRICAIAGFTLIVGLVAFGQASEPAGKNATEQPVKATAGNVLKAGTAVKLVFAQSLSSKHVVTGEKIELRLAEDLKVGDEVVVAKGARVLGTVTQGKKDEKYRKSKNLMVRVDYIVAGDKRIKLTGEQSQKGTVSSGAVTAATIGFGLSGLLFALDQKEAWIKEGTPIIGEVAEDVIFEGPARSAIPVSQPAPAE